MLEKIAEQSGRDLSNFTYSVRNRLHIVDSNYEVTQEDDSGSDDPPYLLRGTVTQITDTVKQYKELGVSHIIFDPVADDLDGIFNTLEEVSKEIIPFVTS